MSQNRRVWECAANGFNVQDLLDDRIPPNDGFIWVPGAQWMTDSTNWTKLRVTDGIYALDRTSAGAETHYLGCPQAQMTRYNVGTSGVKGVFVRDFYISYQILTVSATSGVLSYCYADYDAGTVSSLGSGDLAAYLTVGTHVITANFTTPQYLNQNSSHLVTELILQIPNTCRFVLYGGGYHVEHDYL